MASKNKEKNKIKFKRSRVIATCVLFVLTCAVFSLSAFVPPDRRYLNQLIILIGTVMLVITLVSFFKLFTAEIRRELYRRISQAMFNAGEKWRAVRARVRKFFGLPERADMRGQDERRIVFDDTRRSGSKKKEFPKVRYSQLDDNRKRVRFLWAKYVIDRSNKETSPAVYNTPEEIRGILPEDAENEELFGLYYAARYSPSGTLISDEETLRQAKFVGTNGKI